MMPTTLEHLESLRSMLSGKWKLDILFQLAGGAARWNTLVASLPDAAPNVLTRQLRQLERDGLIFRNVLSAQPPQVVEYALTAKGQHLAPLLFRLVRWDETFRQSFAG